jgi:CheY-like chemotaxis protein
MPDGGIITFHTENVNSSEFCKNNIVEQATPCDYIKLCITDTGIGMDENIKSQIFEPFFTTKEVGKGTGMGLAAVYGTVKNHKGCICVDSAPDEGSTFIICFPVQDSGFSKEEDDDNSDSMNFSKNIMVIDDEKIFRNLVEDFLDQPDFKVFAFSEGESAIDFYKHHWKDIDLIILDMIMPLLGGKETFIQLRKINPDATVVISSGYSLDGDAKELMTMGAHSFIQKPFEKKILEETISGIFI